MKTDTESKNIDQEIAEVQRKFRMLENDKRSYLEESQACIRKQRSTIEKLTRENRQMKQDLVETKRPLGENTKTANAMQKISDETENVKDQIEKMCRLRKQSEHNVNTIRQQMMVVREQLGANGGVNAARVNYQTIQNQKAALANRLDRVLQKFNESVAENKELRQQIDALRQERIVFNNIYKTLESDLQKKKKEMANIIEQANAAYEARDEAFKSVSLLKAQAEKEHAEFEKEWSELGRLIENDKKMKEFMRQKERAKQVEKDTESGVQEAKKSSTGKSCNQAWKMAKEKQDFHASQEKMRTYEDAFSKIQAATGICSIGHLVETFNDAEKQNFRMFKLNSELNREIESLESEIEKQQLLLSELKGTSQKESTEKADDYEYFRMVEECQMQQQAETKVTSEVERMSKQLQAIQRGAGVLFDHLNAKRPTSVDVCLTDNPSSVTSMNLTEYLAAIEDKVEDFYRRAWIANMMSNEDIEERQFIPKANASHIKLGALPTTMEEDSDGEEGDARSNEIPKTYSDLLAAVTKKLTKNKRSSAKTPDKSIH